MPTSWTLYAIHENGEERELSLSLGLPEKADIDWNTEFRFRDGTNEEIWPSPGIDPLSSILLAIGGIISKFKPYVDRGFQLHLSTPANEENALPFEVLKMSLDHLMDIVEPSESETAGNDHDNKPIL